MTVQAPRLSGHTLRWYLEGQVEGGHTVRRIAVRRVPFGVGRLPGLGLTLGSGSISRAHAELFVRGETLHVRDLTSRNGTFVNGARVKEAPLHEGDVIQFAELEFRIGREEVEDTDDQSLEPSLRESSARRAGARSAPGDDFDPSTIQRILSRVTVGTPRSQAGLTVVPLLDPQAPLAAAYLTLDEALARQALRVTEVSESGSVGKLRVENLGEQPVLLVDGEELVGGKQNRTLNLTIMVAGRATLDVPVSCVERERWQYRAAAFSSSPQTTSVGTRALKARTVSESLWNRGSYDSDQGAVWTDIADTTVRTATISPTAASADVFETHRGRIDKVISAFGVEPEQVGAVFALGGRVVGADMFDCPATLRRLLPKLLRGYAVETLYGTDPVASAVSATAEAAQSFLEAVAASPYKSFRGVGAGHDLRFRTRGVSGGALAVKETVVHLVAFHEE